MGFPDNISEKSENSIVDTHKSKTPSIDKTTESSRPKWYRRHWKSLLIIALFFLVSAGLFSTVFIPSLAALIPFLNMAASITLGGFSVTVETLMIAGAGTSGLIAILALIRLIITAPNWLHRYLVTLKERKKWQGITNFGANCYMNAALQCLRYGIDKEILLQLMSDEKIKKLEVKLKKEEKKLKKNNGEIKDLKEKIAFLKIAGPRIRSFIQRGVYNDYEARMLRDAIMRGFLDQKSFSERWKKRTWIKGYTFKQGDAREFLAKFLDLIGAPCFSYDETTTKHKEKSNEEKRKGKKHYSELFLELDIAGLKPRNKKKSNKKEDEKKEDEKKEVKDKLSVLVKKYFAFSELSLKNAQQRWFGDNEKKGMCTSVSTQKELTALPNSLALHLKRYGYGDNHRAFKKDTTIQLDNFTLTDKNMTTATYAVKTVVCHLGSLKGGHYITYVKDDKEVWWKLDDACVTKIEILKDNGKEKGLMQKNAYIVFCKKTKQ